MSFFKSEPFVAQVERELASVIEQNGLRVCDETPSPTASDGAIVTLENASEGIPEIGWWGGGCLALSFLISGKHRGDPLPSMPAQSED